MPSSSRWSLVVARARPRRRAGPGRDPGRGHRPRPRQPRSGPRLRLRELAGAGQRRRGPGGLPARRRRGGHRGGPGAGRGDAGRERRGPAPDLHACAATRASGRRPTGRCGPATSRRAWSACSWPARPGARCSASSAAASAFERTGSGGIAGIVARDATGEVEISLTRSDPSILHVLALPFAFVLPARHAGRRPEHGPGGLGGAVPHRRLHARPRASTWCANAGYGAGAAGPAVGRARRHPRGHRREPGRRRRRGHRLPAAAAHARPGAGRERRRRARAAPRGGHHLLLLHEHAPRRPSTTSGCGGR